MNYYILELKNEEGKTEEIKLRLKSADCIAIEKKTGQSMLDLVQEYSFTNIAMLLKYMRRSELPQFSDEDAYDLLDRIIDSGYVLEDIVSDIIYGGLATSGFFKKEDLTKLKEKAKKSPQDE